MLSTKLSKEIIYNKRKWLWPLFIQSLKFEDWCSKQYFKHKMFKKVMITLSKLGIYVLI